LEESLAIIALKRRAEIEFYKTMAVINAIITVGNGITKAITQSPDSGSSDALNKTVDVLKEALLPHWAEDTDKRAKEARAKLEEEINRGPLKIQVMSKSKKKRRG
jgi:hypothetical protein